MAIRTLSPQPSARSLPAFLSARAWPGLRSWLVSVLSSAMVFSALAAFAWRSEAHRLPDLTTSLVTIPATALAILLGIALLWRLLAQIPVTAGLTFLARLLPIAWVVPLLDMIRSAGEGFVITNIPFDGPGYVLAALTATLLPAEIPIPLAIRAGILATVLMAAFVVWFSRRALVQSVVMGVLTSAVLVKAIFFPAALGLWQGLFRGEGLVRGAGSLGREAVIAVTNGYWWLNIYERFPTAVDVQSAAGIRLATAGYAVLGLGLLLTAYLLWLIPSMNRIVRHSLHSWSSLHAALFVFMGGLVAVLFGGANTVFQANWWAALFLILLLVAALRFHFVLERCLFGSDSLEGCLPSALARDLSLGALLFALVAAWVLGWPVFSAVLAAIAASILSRHSLWGSWPWAATLFRAAGAGSLALAGFFFASQSAHLAVAAISIALISAVYQVGAELFVHKTSKS